MSKTRSLNSLFQSICNFLLGRGEGKGEKIAQLHENAADGIAFESKMKNKPHTNEYVRATGGYPESQPKSPIT